MNANQSFTPALPRPSKSALCSAFVGADLATLRTPAPIIDRAIARRNCVRMLEIARDWKVNSSSIDVEKATEGAEFRAHVKTHKTLEATLLQLQPDAEHQPELKTGRAIVSTIPEAWGLLEENEANDDADVARMKHLLEDVLYSLPLPVDKISELFALRKRLRAYSKAGSSAQLRLMVDNVMQLLALQAFMESQPATSASSNLDPWSIFVKIECGGKRAGLDPESSNFRTFIHTAQQSSFVSIYGFYSHAGQSYASKSLAQADDFLTEELRVVQLACEVAMDVLDFEAGSEAHTRSRHTCPFRLSVGATPTAHAARAAHTKAEKLSGTVELHAGNYPLLDLQQIATAAIPSDPRAQLSNGSSCDDAECTSAVGGGAKSAMADVAFSILSTVIAEYPERAASADIPSSSSGQRAHEWAADGSARPGDEAMCDAGGIALSKDQGPLGGLGHVVWPAEKIGWEIARASQEHGVMALRKGGAEKWMQEWAYDKHGDAQKTHAVHIGDKIRIVPQHACLTAAQYPFYYIVDSDRQVKGSPTVVEDVWVPWKFW